MNTVMLSSFPFCVEKLKVDRSIGSHTHTHVHAYTHTAFQWKNREKESFFPCSAPPRACKHAGVGDTNAPFDCSKKLVVRS
mmetsp:Transcript_42880/g.84571  ORF Transcript_42880/g.84571 Transcript_42880/m.84571 type:complete len:81 (+) Transcript_42880:1520-1762(+)